jgi:tetratricopeptide (TPR) repeat protein
MNTLQKIYRLNNRIPRLVRMLLMTAVSCIFPLTTLAVTWAPLARTARHDVAIETGSVRLTDLSRLAVWLRFTPLGEVQRRQAAAEYGQKTYRLHLEHYEIDCSEPSAVLTLVEILGPANKRLARTKGGSTPEAVIPGSVLDLAARKVCPDLEENPTAAEEEFEAPDSGLQQEELSERQVPEDLSRMIAQALQKTESDPKDLEAWRQLGNAYFDADMPTQAIEAYNQALSIKPDDTNILNDQGAMYRQTGDFNRALANFEKARSVDRSNLESLYNIGYVLAFDLNQINRALAVWRSYLALDTTSETSRQVRSFIERYGASSTK